MYMYDFSLTVCLLAFEIRLKGALDHKWHHFVGRVVKASALRAEEPGFEFRSHRDFSRVKSYQ